MITFHEELNRIEEGRNYWLNHGGKIFYWPEIRDFDPLRVSSFGYLGRADGIRREIGDRTRSCSSGTRLITLGLFLKDVVVAPLSMPIYLVSKLVEQELEDLGLLSPRTQPSPS